MFTLSESKTESESIWTREDICFASDDICKDGLFNTYPVHILSFGEDEAGRVSLYETIEFIQPAKLSTNSKVPVPK